MNQPAAPELITLEAVRKSYNLGRPSEAEVLHGIDLQVRRGEFIALMGPSGSGKSTLLNILGLLERMTTGSYLLDGEAVQGLDDAALTLRRRSTLGFVFQFHNLCSRTRSRFSVCFRDAIDLIQFSFILFESNKHSFCHLALTNCIRKEFLFFRISQKSSFNQYAWHSGFVQHQKTSLFYASIFTSCKLCKRLLYFTCNINTLLNIFFLHNGNSHYGFWRFWIKSIIFYFIIAF